jgi:hypothetical protein
VKANDAIALSVIVQGVSGLECDQVELNSDIYYSEVRALGRELGVDEDQVMRHVSEVHNSRLYHPF